MARVTIASLQEQLRDLETRYKEQLKINIQLNNEISEIQNKADDNFENSSTYRQMNKKIDYLETVIKGHEISIKAKEVTIKKNRDTIQELLKENEQLKATCNINKLGRKERFTEQDKETIKMYYLQKEMSIRKLAEMYNCSIGLIHKIIKE